ncbi:hypothetical protein RSUY_09860 [Ralstonia solanacearum]|uniref:hypothetical protein n=1 Tax=Ralstonia solanacearum TaxID=305 RepID=UPI0006CB37FC|nr:hypothetical protein [Ralstonia solanacearum]ALF87361.1 hypothetical protein RSUY_09860 [Ralstonia solanacearum]
MRLGCDGRRRRTEQRRPDPGMRHAGHDPMPMRQPVRQSGRHVIRRTRECDAGRR